MAASHCRHDNVPTNIALSHARQFGYVLYILPPPTAVGRFLYVGKRTKMKSKSAALIQLKNQVRGAFGALDNKTPAKTSAAAIAQERRGSAAVKKALAEARKRLSGRDLGEFEQWVESQYAARSVSDEIATSKTLLGLLPEAIARRRLTDTLRLTIESLQRSRTRLLEFLEKLESINLSITENNFELALSQVNQAIADYGYSFWSIEAKIAILNSMSRSDEAKSFSAELSIGAVGLNAFYLYHFGQRNDPSQSSARFRSIISKRINESELSGEYKVYAEYRTARVIPLKSVDIAAVISYEQITTKVDLLLTSRRLAIEIAAQPWEFDAEEVSLARSVIGLFSRDEFIDATGNLRLSEDLEKSIKRGVLLAVNQLVPKHVGPTTQLFSSGISSIVTYSGSEADEERLRKHVMNYWWIDDTMMLDSARSFPRLPEWLIRQGLDERRLVHPVLAACDRSFEYARSLKPEQWRIPTLDEPPEAPIWTHGRQPDAVSDCIATSLAWRSFEHDEYGTAMRVMQFALQRNPRLLPALPLDRMFSGVDFERIRSYGISVDLCNCLNWYTQVNSERQIRTYKRFAIEEWVEKTRESGIVAAAEQLCKEAYPSKLSEFFLANTCDLATIELLLEVEGTRDALRIRERLLRLASLASESAAAQLTAEADSIADKLEVDNVLDELDETKVSVDEEALLPVVAREVAADFERYKQLTQSDKAPGSSLDELIRSLRQQSPLTFQIPKSETDNLLVDIIQTVLDRFVDDPVYGLDTIIGRRIRHGTISSELRGTLEHLHLIGQRPRTGADYDVPSSVASYLVRYDQKTRRGATRAFGRFSQQIDNLVAQLRDEVFQCKPKGQLKPAFELPLGVLMFAMARDIAATSPNIEHFLRELFDTFWFSLSTLVERERVTTQEFMSRALRESCSKFIADLRGAKLSDASFLASIQSASEELQRRADTIANWIRIPKDSQLARTYPIGLVFDAAMAMCKARRVGFDPTSTDDIDRAVRLDAHGYPIVFDALCIAIENVAQHSGIKQGNKLNTEIKLSSDGSRLSFTITSDLSRDAWTREKSQRVDAIREDIIKRSFEDRARRTSGSGLSKLAAIVHQRSDCNIEFGPKDNNQRFRLYFELIFISRNEESNSQSALL